MERAIEEPVELAQRDFGGPDEGEPVVVLHGLLGSSRNWMGAAKRMAERHRVIALDLRNHGDSPHHPLMNYAAMAADVRAWAQARQIPRMRLIGHSMGGKVAMRLAVDAPQLVAGLVVADIAPRRYPPRWQKEFALMRSIDVAAADSRAAVEKQLEQGISDWAFRKFLVTNLERREDGGFRWTVNLVTLEAALPELFEQVPHDGEQYNGPVCFIRGERSRFIDTEADAAQIRQHFPVAEIVTIAAAGHNVHFDQPERFASAVDAFLSGIW
jgi:pimeloyl-ACP methyl ester carboxylesterase